MSFVPFEWMLCNYYLPRLSKFYICTSMASPKNCYRTMDPLLQTIGFMLTLVWSRCGDQPTSPLLYKFNMWNTIKLSWFKMCLWSVQYCPECFSFTSISHKAPQHCNNADCLRSTLDPNQLTRQEILLYMTDDDPCQATCQKAQCGLIIHNGWYDIKDAFCQECCESDTESDSDHEE